MALLDSAFIAAVLVGVVAAETWTIDQNAVVNKHKDFRAQAAPSASNMENMKWDANAAGVAEVTAAKCVYAHDDASPAGYGYCGQNIHASAGGSPDLTLSNAITYWHSEVNHFEYGRGSTVPGKKVGHYTQLMWATTNSVGCAGATCTKNSPWGEAYPTWYLVVCNYCPGGNNKGASGNSSPYKLGATASDCPNGATSSGDSCKPSAQPSSG